MTPIRRRGFAAGLAAAALVLAGCAGSPQPEYEVLDVGTAPAEATAQGATLALGETAWILDEETGVMVGTTVREVREIDPDSIDGFADDPELSGLTPYAVITQYDFEGGTNYIDVIPIDESGETVGWLADSVGNTAQGDADACGIALPELEISDGVELECFVALGDGAPVVGAVYNGSSRSSTFADDSHPFAAAPITWR